MLAALDLGSLFSDVGPVLLMGSYISGLMCWRDLDVGLLAGAECSPSDVLDLLKPLVDLPGFVGFTYRDERGPRCPTGEARDERYHLPFDLDAGLMPSPMSRHEKPYTLPCLAGSRMSSWAPW